MQDQSIEIRIKEIYEQLSPTQQKLASCILNHQGDTLEVHHPNILGLECDIKELSNIFCYADYLTYFLSLP